MRKIVMKGSHSYGKGTYSTYTRSNAKSIPSSWENQQSMSSYRSNNQPLKSPSGWNFVVFASPRTTISFKKSMKLGRPHTIVWLKRTRKH